jgi:hypothetical protein
MTRKPYVPPAVVAEVEYPTGAPIDVDAGVAAWRAWTPYVRPMTAAEVSELHAERRRLEEQAAPHREAHLGDLLALAVEALARHGELDLLERVLSVVPRCVKGCCLKPATRVADYGVASLDRLVQQDSCDGHGVDETARDRPYAEALRAAEAALVAAGRPPWWIQDGGNRPPRRKWKP